MLVWTFRILIVLTAVLGILVTLGGCTLPTVRVKCVHLVEPPAKSTADVAVRYKGSEFVTSVEIERIQREDSE